MSDNTPIDEKGKKALLAEAVADSASPDYSTPFGGRGRADRNALGQYQRIDYIKTPKKDTIKSNELLGKIEDIESPMSRAERD